MIQPKKQLSRTAFAAAVLAGTVATAAENVESAKRDEWIAAAKARYKERCGDSIPDADAQLCAETCFGMNCMAGLPGNYYVQHHKDWPDALVAADNDMESWGREEGERA